jgi:hypothetical protein
MGAEELTGDNIDGLKTPSAGAQVDVNFARWARSQLSSKQVSRITLKLQDSTPSGTIVESWEKNQLAISSEEIITAIYTAAEMDARQFAGMQTYFAFFYIDDGKDGQVLRSSFRIQGGKGASEDLMSMEGSEAPTGKGLISQLMRHTEASTRTALMGAQAAQNTLVTIINNMSAQLARSEAREIRVMELHENLLDKTFERDMKRENQKSMREVATTLGNQLLPMIGARLIGAGGSPMMTPQPQPQPVEVPDPSAVQTAPPSGASQEAQVLAFIQQLVVSFTDEQIMVMAGQMDQTQRDGFLQVYKFFKAHQAEAARIAAENQTPEVTVKPSDEG